jgi:uncharacterized protein (DUF58 family)
LIDKYLRYPNTVIFIFKKLKDILNIHDIQFGFLGSSLEFLAKHIVEGFITGLHRSPFHGFSVEFAEHRIYNSGESTRHIDWKLFGRTDKLFVKKYEEETNLRCHIVIDTSSSMLYPYKEKNQQSKLAFSVFCAASLIYLLRKQRDAVGLSFFANTLELHTEAKLSSVHANRLYAELDNLLTSIATAKLDKNTQKQTNAAAVLHQIAESIHKRSLVIIFSDMLDTGNPDELFQAMQHLRYKKHEVILFHTFDKQREEKFEFTNRPYRFIDMESGEEIKVSPNDVRENYQSAVNHYFNELKMKCGQYQIDLVEADVYGDFREVLMAYLLKRGKLF